MLTESVKNGVMNNHECVKATLNYKNNDHLRDTMR